MDRTIMATFGKTDTGTTQSDLSADYVKGIVATLTETADVTSMSLHGCLAVVGSEPLKMGIYDVTAGHPINQEGLTNEITVTDNSNVRKWWTATFATALRLAPADYGLIMNQDTIAWRWSQDAVAGALHYDASAYPAFVDPMSCEGHSDRQVCIHATYTPVVAAAGGGKGYRPLLVLTL